MKQNNLYLNYDKTRFKFNKDRKTVWFEVTRHLQRYIPTHSTILELGSGYCDFINLIKARKKYALDKYINPKEYASTEVQPIFGDFDLMDKKIPPSSLDFAFASNFFEHLTDLDMDKCISVLKNKLKPNGTLIILQPNYRLCYKNYFDDFTHVKVWSDISLSDFLRSRGFGIALLKPGFLPFSMKSRIPKIAFLIRAYLNSPFKPFAGQMLVIARLRNQVKDKLE